MANYTLENGVGIQVSPLSSFTMSQISQRAKELHPDIDASAYNKPDPFSSYDGEIPGESTDEYRLARNAVTIKRNSTYKRMAFLMGVRPAEGVTESDMVSQFETEITRAKTVLGLQDVHEWEVLILHVLVSIQDERNITNIVTSQKPVTMEDVVKTIPFSAGVTKESPP